MAIRAKIVTITPDQAFELTEKTRLHYEKLGRPDNFRPSNMHYIQEIADQIGTEDWDVNGEAIKVTDAGSVIDGRHRLDACMLSGRPMTTLVIYGVDESMIMDAGRPRRFENYLRHMGIKYSVVIATMMRLVLGTSGSGRFSPGIVTGWRSPARMMRHYKQIDKEIMSAADYVMNHGGGSGSARNGLIPASILAYGCLMARRVDRKMADEFINKCITGAEITEASPIYQLRKRMIANAKSETKLRPVAVVCLMIQAWGLWFDGTPCHELRFTDKENNPSWRFGGRGDDAAADEQEASKPRLVKKAPRAAQMSAKGKR